MRPKKKDKRKSVLIFFSSLVYSLLFPMYECSVINLYCNIQKKLWRRKKKRNAESIYYIYVDAVIHGIVCSSGRFAV